MLQAHRCILFDLDGTLVDTAPDMEAALNRLRGEQGLSVWPPGHLRSQVSNGAAGLLRHGMPAADAETIEGWRLRFLELYAESVCEGSRLFDDLPELLVRLESSGRCWGVVTNKPRFLAEPLLEQLGLAERMACLVAGDDLELRKPHPEPLWHACRLAKVEPAQAAYLGDAPRDIEAARAAGLVSVAAGWGYLEDGVNAAAWGADLLLERPGDLDGYLWHVSGADA